MEAVKCQDDTALDINKLKGNRALDKRYWRGKTEVFRGKPLPLSVCPSEIPHGLAGDWSRSSAVRFRRLICALGWPYTEGTWGWPYSEGTWGWPYTEGTWGWPYTEGTWGWLYTECTWGWPYTEGTWGWPYTEGTWLYCEYFIWCVSCTVVFELVL